MIAWIIGLKNMFQRYAKQQRDYIHQWFINIFIIRFPDVAVQNISVREWVNYFDEQEKINLKRARVIFVQAKSAINWCIGRQVISTCELTKINPKNIGVKTEVGERVLSYAELAKIWVAIE